MARPACFVYKENVDFVFPEALAALPRALCEFAVPDETPGAKGGIAPHPDLFTHTTDPAKADLFLFPFRIGAYNDAGMLDVAAQLIAALPFLPGNEKRHFVFDDGDRSDCLPLPVCLFKYSLLKKDAQRAVVNALPLPRHVADDKPDFAFDRVRYDLSFVGNLTNEARRAAIVSIQKQAPHLRLAVDFDNAFSVESGHIRLRERSAAEQTEREDLYRKSIKDSWAVLCPPGVGLQSYRMYESMYLGRIPVLFGEQALYPFEDRVNYEEFSIRIAGSNILDSGRILAEWFAAHTPARRADMCRLACRAWHRYFHPTAKLPLLLEAARALFGFA